MFGGKNKFLLFYLLSIIFKDVFLDLETINCKYCIKASVVEEKKTDVDLHTYEENIYWDIDQNIYIKDFQVQIFQIWDKIKNHYEITRGYDCFFAMESYPSLEIHFLFFISHAINKTSDRKSQSIDSEITKLNILYDNIDFQINNILDFDSLPNTHNKLINTLIKYKNSSYELKSAENHITNELRRKIKNVIRDLHSYHKILLPEFENVGNHILKYIEVERPTEDKYLGLYLLVSLLRKILNKIDDDKSAFRTYLFIYNIDINMENNNKKLVIYLRLVLVSLLKYIDMDAYKLLEYSILILLESFIYSSENIQKRNILFYLNGFIKMHLRLFYLSNNDTIEIYQNIDKFLVVFFANRLHTESYADGSLEYNFIFDFSKIFPNLNINIYLNNYINQIKYQIMTEVKIRLDNFDLITSSKVQAELERLFRCFIPNFIYTEQNAEQVICYPELPNILPNKLSFNIIQNIYISSLNNILVYILLDDRNQDLICLSYLYHDVLHDLYLKF